jgi:hypothetical protein
MKRPDFSSLMHFPAGTTFPFMHMTTAPAQHTDVAAIAQPKLKDASESTNRSGFVAPVNAMTALSLIRF